MTPAPHPWVTRQEKSCRQRAGEGDKDRIHVGAEEIQEAEEGHQHGIQLRVEVFEDIRELR